MSALLAAKLRFRPILMTAFAFILGVVPLLTAAGAGAEGRKVMGMAVFAGMLVATILGVILIPMLYVVVMKVTGGTKQVPRASRRPATALATEHGRGATEMIAPLLSRALAGAMSLSAALAGCTVGPNYERPQMPAPDQFRFVDGPAQAQSLADTPVVRRVPGPRRSRR